ncbi:MAG: hypothetical protein HYX69_21605 [Planctomycetia bacterium]|nr:hypothetical protein [Planctomycetia bacterium]
MPMLAMLVAGVAVVAGCDRNPTRVPVSGQVLIDGAPLKFGQVRFIPSGGRPSEGDLDENGRFTLSSFKPNDGAALGVHQVAVIANEQLSYSETRWHAPKKYANYQASGLTQEITGSTDSVVITLSWEGGKPFVEVDKTPPVPSKSGE